MPEAPVEDTFFEVLLLLLPLLMIVVAMIFVLVAPFVMYLVLRLRPCIALRDRDEPINITYEEQLESTSAVQGAQERWLEHVDDATRAGYERGAQWCLQHSPASPRDTDITMPQFVGIQEKGVSAWTFDVDYDVNVGALVSARTEIQFLDDSPGMTPSEGGACTVQTNLPLPKMNDVYYWEAKIFSKPTTTTIALGLATKPYPSFRFPGLCKHSVAYFSQDGFKCFNHPVNATSYGPPYVKGDVIGIGYRPRTGTVFYTRNGFRIDEAFVGLYGYNLFPTVAANGAAEVHVNLGQAGFVFIEANVKKWGLAPMVGTLAPPPAYGNDKGSILIESGYAPSSAATTAHASDGTAPSRLARDCATLTTDVRTGELIRVPSYQASVRGGTSGSRRGTSSSLGIRMDTLRNVANVPLAVAPPPYSPVKASASHNEGPSGAAAPPATPVPSPSLFSYLRHWWLGAGRSRPPARRGASTNSDPNPTELVGVTIE